MSTPPSFPVAAESGRGFNPHLSIAILALAFAVFLIAQTGVIEGQKEVLRYQIENTRTQDDNLVKAERQLKDLATKREGSVKQSVELQARFQAILNDLIELAKEDKDAKEVVETWKIQRSGPAAAPEKPAATP